MKSLKLICLLIIACFIVLPSSLSAEISSAQFEIIRVAFMNGYVDALKSDISTIQVLKQDKSKLKYFSRQAVDSYMDKVILLNQDDSRKKKSDKTVNTGTNSMTL